MTEPEPLTLYRISPEKGTYVWSAFATKLEFHLRHSHIPYTTRAGSARSAPEGRIPYVSIPSSGPAKQGLGSPISPPEITGDSIRIIQHLVSQGRAADLNADLTRAQKAQDLALRALLEERLFFFNVRERWLGNYYVQREKALWATQWFFRPVVGMMVYRKVVAGLTAQGTMRFSEEEVSGMRREVWESLEGLLAESRMARGKAKGRKKAGEGDSECFWVLGEEEPTEADACLFGFVTSAILANSGPETQKLVRSFPVIMDYASRIHDRYFPDYKKWKEEAG